MRRSPLRHSLAVLRTTIGLTQKELAKLVNRATRTIQAVELGNLPLSEELAKDIGRETGVNPGWLLDNDPTDPPVKGYFETGASDPDPRYTRKDFEFHRAIMEGKISREEVRKAYYEKRDQPVAPVTLSIELVAQEEGRFLIADLDRQTLEGLRQLLDETRGRQSAGVVRWKIREFLEELAQEDSIKLEFEHQTRAFLEELRARAEKRRAEAAATPPATEKTPADGPAPTPPTPSPQ